MHIETVRVVNPNEPSSFMTINLDDLTDAHDLWEPVKAPVDDMAVRVGKGPRGRWYGWRGKDRVTDSFETEAEAQAALEALSANTQS